MPQLRSSAPSGRAMRAVRLLAAALAVLFLLAPSRIAAQTDKRGSISGVVTNGTTNEPQPGVEIRLLGGLRDDDGNFSQEISEFARSDARGRFEFSELPSGEDRAYALDAAFDGGSFPGGVVTIPADGDVIEVEQRVWDTTTDPRAIVIQRNNMFLLRGDDGASVIDSYTIINVSEEAYIGRGAKIDEGSEEGPVPTLSFSFPEGAEGLQIADSDLDIPELLNTETGVGITSAVPPNETRITFAYQLPVNTGQVDLSRRALYPILNLGVFAEPPFTIDSTRLAEDGEVTIEGETYTRYSSQESVTEGNSIPMIATAEGSTDTALIAGAAVAGVLLLVILVLVLIRRRSRQPSPERRPAEHVDESRDDLLVAIARLDLEYRNGELDEKTWSARRAELKARLAEHKSPEPAVE
jgi:hypothetical protein